MLDEIKIIKMWNQISCNSVIQKRSQNKVKYFLIK